MSGLHGLLDSLAGESVAKDRSDVSVVVDTAAVDDDGVATVSEDGFGGVDDVVDGVADDRQYEHHQSVSAQGGPGADDEESFRGASEPAPTWSGGGAGMGDLSRDGNPFEGLSARWSRATGTNAGP